MAKEKISAKQLARMLTDAGVPADKRKVMRWRGAGPGKTLKDDSAAALDRIFGTVNVFGQFVYTPERRGTSGALAGRAADYVTRAEHEELLDRVERLERGA